jgi:hypothetical protein
MVIYTLCKIFYKNEKKQSQNEKKQSQNEKKQSQMKKKLSLKKIKQKIYIFSHKKLVILIIIYCKN